LNFPDVNHPTLRGMMSEPATDETGRGCVLGSDEIRRRVIEEKSIFVQETWDEENLRPAGYDLTVAPDFMIYPDGHGSWSRVQESGKCSEFTLQSGDVAFVSSREKLRLPWNLSGQVSGRFSYLQQGVLILAGMIVDPGYGLNEDKAADGERLHFWIANVGERALTIRPGRDHIASIQFFPVLGSTLRTRYNTGREIDQQYFQHPHDLFALGFFSRMTQFKQETEAMDRRLQQATERIEHDLSQRMSKLDKRVDGLADEMSGVTKGTNQVLLFGIVLLLVTFIGVVLSTALAMLGGDNAATAVANAAAFVNALDGWKFIALCIFFASLSIAILSPLWYSLRSLSKVEADKTGLGAPR
jgi:deoxycytidine triphosphate deaminase